MNACPEGGIGNGQLASASGKLDFFFAGPTFETDEQPQPGLVRVWVVWPALLLTAISYTRNHKSGNLICAPRDDQFKAAPAKCDQLSLGKCALNI